jgi:mevalonate kinase
VKRLIGRGAPKASLRRGFGLTASAALVVVALLAMSVFFGGCGSSSESGVATPAAPVFSGKTLAGDDVSLTMYRGKPLVLVFMASW